MHTTAGWKMKKIGKIVKNRKTYEKIEIHMKKYKIIITNKNK